MEEKTNSCLHTTSKKWKRRCIKARYCNSEEFLLSARGYWRNLGVPLRETKNSSTIFLELKGKGPSQTNCTSQQPPEENGGERHEVYHTAADSCTGVLAELLWRKEVQSVRKSMIRTQMEEREGGDTVTQIIWKSWTIYEVVRLQPGNLWRWGWGGWKGSYNVSLNVSLKDWLSTPLPIMAEASLSSQECSFSPAT